MQIIFRVYDEQICCKVNDRNLKRAAAAAAAAAADPCLCAVQISDITYEQARASYREFEGGELGLREGYLVVGNQGHGGGLPATCNHINAVARQQPRLGAFLGLHDG